MLVGFVFSNASATRNCFELQAPPKTAGARYGEFAKDPLNLGTKPRANIDDTNAGVKQLVKANGKREWGVDTDGRAKGLFAGLPGTRDAGQMKKDFLLARYGECNDQPVHLKTSQSARGSMFGGGQVCVESAAINICFCRLP